MGNMIYRFIHINLKHIWIAILLVATSSRICAQDIVQDISDKQVQNAQSQARFLIESFGEFLQIIATSQDGGEVRDMIRMATQDGQLSKRLFTDQKVLIVSDIDPRVVDEESTVGEGFTEISSYLADFDAFYDKNQPNDIIINDIYVSRIKKSRLTGKLYVRVKYRSRFEGRHKNIRKPYAEINRMARVQIQQGDQWSYYIDQITFLPVNDTTQYFEIETREQIADRYKTQLRYAQKLWDIYEYEAALHNYQLSNQIFTVDSITDKIDYIEEVIDDQKDRKYFGLEGYDRKISDEPNNPDLYYERGLKHLEAKKAKAANDDFLKALSLSNNLYKKAWIGLADIWEQEKGISAIEYLEAARKLDPEDRETLARLIRIQVEAGLWTDAKKSLLSIHQIEEDSEMLMYLGIVNQNLDQYKEATENFHRYLELNPGSALGFFELGKSYLNLSEFDLSMQNFKEAIAINGQEFSKTRVANVYVEKAKSLRVEEKETLAEIAVDQALSLLPQMSEAKNLKKSLRRVDGGGDPVLSDERKEGDLYFMEGNYKEAMRFYRSLIKKNPRDRDLSLKIGKCYFELEDYGRALSAAENILSSNNRDEEALLLKAAALSKRNDHAGALSILGQVLKINPSNKEALLKKTEEYLILEDYLAAFLNLGRWENLQIQTGSNADLQYRKLKAEALVGLEKIFDALVEIDYILQRENLNTRFLYLKAYCLFEQEEYDECISFADAALKTDAKYDDALVLKVKAYLKKGSPQLALSSINQLQGINKEMYTISYYKSLANYDLGDHKTAKIWIDRAIKADRDDLDALLLNGKILLALERFLDAGMALNTAYKINPNHPEANFELGRYYHEYGVRQSEDKRFEDALPYYYKAYELAPELFENFPELLKRLRG